MPKGKQIKENEGLLYGYTDEEWKSFHKSKRSRIRHPEMQKRCMENWAKKQPKESHYIRARKSNLKISYGITLEDYDRMLQDQSGRCAICGTSTPTGKWKVFAVDHCHKTNEVRGLLCNECNRGMGLLGDNIDRLKNAVKYLEKHTKKTKEEREVRNGSKK